MTHRRSPEGEGRRKRKRSTIFHRHSDQHWNCFKGFYSGETSAEVFHGARMSFLEHVDSNLNSAELNRTKAMQRYAKIY